MEHFDVVGNTLPVFVDVKGFLKDVRNTPYAYLSGGEKANDSFEKGVILETGVGFKFFISKRICFNVSLAYNLRRITDYEALLEIIHTDQEIVCGYVKNPMIFHSTSFRIGLFFLETPQTRLSQECS